jgi:glutamate-5-semialdehyde dehydrogenase
MTGKPAVTEVVSKAQTAKKAWHQAVLLDAQSREKVLLAMAEALEAKSEEIIEANSIDVQNGRKKGLSEAMIDRLILNKARIKGMAIGLREVAQLPDDLGKIHEMQRRPNGLLVGRMVVPLGLVAMIYESRPNVTADAIGLCIKSGNTVLLRGGSEALTSNVTIAKILSDTAYKAGFPAGGIQIIETADREAVNTLFTLRKYIDVLIPRGGEKFIQYVVENARIPTIETGAGNCHTYIDKYANLERALEIVYNAKVQRPSVCNATKKVLIHKDVASAIAPKIYKKLHAAGVIFLTEEDGQQYFPKSKLITEEEWFEEFLDMRLGIKIINSLQKAIDHINKYGSKHTEAILTEDYSRASRFINAIDAASLIWNASTRFTDGGQFGLGAEIGISTQKLHARGPMGVRELTTTKYVTFGEGQIRS